jgi:hypothetical protein
MRRPGGIRPLVRLASDGWYVCAEKNTNYPMSNYFIIKNSISALKRCSQGDGHFFSPYYEDDFQYCSVKGRLQGVGETRDMQYSEFFDADFE